MTGSSPKRCDMTADPTNAARQAAYRKRHPPEVRGIRAPRSLHAEIKAVVRLMLKPATKETT